MRPFFVADREPKLKGSFIRGSDSLADNSLVNVCRPTAPAVIRDAAPSHCRARLRLAATVLLLTGLALPGAWASDSRDHEKARAAVEAGQVLPLPTLLERLRRTHPGQVLELELEHDDGRWIYEVKLLQANGQLLKLDMDAATGQVLQVKRKDGPKSGRTAERDAGRKVEPSKQVPQ